MGNLKPRETLYLYLFMVAFSLALFAVGVWVGKTYYVDAHAQDTAPLQAPSDHAASSADEEPDLDFYENLVGDDQSGQGSGRQDRAGSEEDGTQAASSAPDSGSSSDGGDDGSSQAASGEPASPESSQSAPTTGYTVQIGAVATQADADQLLRDLNAKGYQGFIVSPDFSRDSLYRVWVGRYAGRSQALNMEGRLKGDGFATYVKAARFPNEE